MQLQANISRPDLRGNSPCLGVEERHGFAGYVPQECVRASSSNAHRLAVCQARLCQLCCALPRPVLCSLPCMSMYGEQEMPSKHHLIVQTESHAVHLSSTCVPLAGRYLEGKVLMSAYAVNTASDPEGQLVLLGEDSLCDGVSCGPDEPGGHAWFAHAEREREWSAEQSVRAML
jgi:hypothetical protein